MGDRLATIDMGRKVGAAMCMPLYVGDLGPNLAQCHLGRGLHIRIKWHLDPCNRLTIIHQSYKQTGQDNGPVA